MGTFFFFFHRDVLRTSWYRGVVLFPTSNQHGRVESLSSTFSLLKLVGIKVYKMYRVFRAPCSWVLLECIYATLHHQVCLPHSLLNISARNRQIWLLHFPLAYLDESSGMCWNLYNKSRRRVKACPNDSIFLNTFISFLHSTLCLPVQSVMG